MLDPILSILIILSLNLLPDRRASRLRSLNG